MCQASRPTGHGRGAPRLTFILLIVAALTVGCGSGGGDASEDPGMAETEPIALGPADGHDLPPTELNRVAVGTMAPDFSLRTLAGDTVTLSSFRGAKDVVLVVYRGHW